MSDFLGFRFGLYHSSDLHLQVVSSSNRYTKNLLPAPTDTTTDVPGADGQYYFGSVYKNREFTINVAFDSLDEPTWRKLAQILATDKLQDLVFDENPYKVYKAKLKSKPDFKYICFRDSDTQERIYKGEGTLNFICYHPLAYCFNKYVVRAADYYKCTMPQDIITNSINDNPYKTKIKPKMLTGLIKDHYNVKPNMATLWKGGYPSIEQVQWGELYFNFDKNDFTNGYSINCSVEATPKRGLIVDVRNYWDNIPKWQGTAKLLTTPTLDYDRNLIYMPQYSTTNYYNMDTGLNRQNALIGSRLLVYNPGDVPVDFELKLGNLTNHLRKLEGTQKFRISRYNVQRLSIEQAVDWTGLRTYNRDEEDIYKYGTHYVTILEPSEGTTANTPLPPSVRHLKKSHPEFLYIVEPIPREKLGHFIRLFWYQSKAAGAISDWEEGKELANRYEELLNLCITEDEKNELYWDTLINQVLYQYKVLNDNMRNSEKFFSENYTWEDFVYDFIYNPPEYIRELTSAGEELDYGEFIFNLTHMPQYYTYDYLEITNENFDKIPATDTNKAQNLFLDFERRLLYNVNDTEDILNYEPTKTYFTDNIVKGHWFQLPPGWSLIDISPIIDEDIWGGKRWIDARPFTWGETDEAARAKFNNYERLAMIDYVSQKSPIINLKRNITDMATNPFSSMDNPTAAQVKAELETWETYQIEDLIQFRRWYETDSAYGNYKNWRTEPTSSSHLKLGNELWHYRIEQAEYGFLKLLADYWRVNQLDVNGMPQEEYDIDEWWWLANNYLWENFPPLYWSYIDLLNNAQIKYIPQFY